VELIETSTFTRQIAALLSDEDYGAFQSRLAANPGLGALIKGGSGIRRDLILLLFAYPKNVSADLTPR
jgi:hypothetical protein